jgi:hypothetical protein
MNERQRKILSRALLWGGPVIGVLWMFGEPSYRFPVRPFAWIIVTVAAGLYVRAGGDGPKK